MSAVEASSSGVILELKFAVFGFPFCLLTFAGFFQSELKARVDDCFFTGGKMTICFGAEVDAAMMGAGLGGVTFGAAGLGAEAAATGANGR